MPNYDFSCENCKTVCELFFHMNDDKKGQCKHCGTELTRQYFVPNMAIDGKAPKTIGELADKNTEKLIKQGALPKSTLEYDKYKKERKKKLEKMDKIAKLDGKQQKEYIYTGKLPE